VGIAEGLRNFPSLPFKTFDFFFEKIFLFFFPFLGAGIVDTLPSGVWEELFFFLPIKLESSLTSSSFFPFFFPPFLELSGGIVAIKDGIAEGMEEGRAEPDGIADGIVEKVGVFKGLGEFFFPSLRFFPSFLEFLEDVSL